MICSVITNQFACLFQTHPSIRIKGTENNYEPILCMDSNCVNKNPHMHCPFCLKTEAYLDPVILKAHYRVKHVDKGIEFAGDVQFLYKKLECYLRDFMI